MMRVVLVMAMSMVMMCTLIEANEVEVTAFVPSCTRLLTTQ